MRLKGKRLSQAFQENAFIIHFPCKQNSGKKLFYLSLYTLMGLVGGRARGKNLLNNLCRKDPSKDKACYLGFCIYKGKLKNIDLRTG